MKNEITETEKELHKLEEDLFQLDEYLLLKLNNKDWRCVQNTILDIIEIELRVKFLKEERWYL